MTLLKEALTHLETTIVGDYDTVMFNLKDIRKKVLSNNHYLKTFTLTMKEQKDFIRD